MITVVYICLLYTSLISDAMQQMLEDGEIDMVTSPRKTQEREEKFDFSRCV